MNTPTQQTISDSVLELQLKEVNAKAKKSLHELNPCTTKQRRKIRRKNI